MDKLAFYEAKKEFNSNTFDRLVSAGTMNFQDPDAEARARKISQEALNEETTRLNYILNANLYHALFSWMR